MVAALANARPDLSWSLEPQVLIPLALAGALYGKRWLRVRASSPRPAADAPVWRLCCFAGALAIAALALVSPVDGLADQLFFVHMVQHVLLLDVAAILAILGLTKVILRPLTRSVHELERSAGPLAHPAFAAALYIAVIWAWHVPGAYDYAVAHPPVHVLEHLTFLLAGGLYWWHVLSPIRARRRLRGMGPVAYMGSTKLFVGALGMGLAFAPSALYAHYVHQPRVWGVSALDDQSLAGIAMAVEQSLVMGVALVVLFVAMLNESEREQVRRERYETA